MNRLPTTDVLIVGSSVRAAAFSALRAGLRPHCGDAFADADLLALCPVSQVADYPAGLLRMARSVGPMPWLYTGPLENHSQLVEQLARERQLWGNGAAVLAGVRDPVQLACVLRSAGLPTPEVAIRADCLPRDGSWLRKPRDSAGGYRIAPLVAGLSQAAEAARVYYQQRIAGRAAAAIFVATASTYHFVGLTLMRCGANAINNDSDPEAALRYSGSLGPVPLEPAQRQQLARLGQTLADHFQLRGLFGVDLVMNDEGFWPIELNPRYTASVEILERALDVPLLAWHALACEGQTLLVPEPSSKAAQAIACESPLWHGKAIVYVEREAPVSESFHQWAMAQRGPWRAPRLADIPAAGEHLKPGMPLLTVFATAESAEPLEAQLAAQTAELQARWWR